MIHFQKGLEMLKMSRNKWEETLYFLVETKEESCFVSTEKSSSQQDKTMVQTVFKETVNVNFMKDKVKKKYEKRN